MDGVFADVSPQRVREGVPWRAARGLASPDSLESFDAASLLDNNLKLHAKITAAEDLLTALRRGRHASGQP